MKIKQSIVVKASFNTYNEAEQAFSSLGFRGMRAYLETDGGPRVVFMVNSINDAIVQSKHLVSKPTHIQIFDPNDITAEGWAQPRTLGLD